MVIEVDEPFPPIAGNSLAIHRITMVLTGNIALLCTDALHWLIVAAMAILEFYKIGTGSQSE